MGCSRFSLVLAFALLFLLAGSAPAADILEVYLGFDSLQGSVKSSAERDVFPFSAVSGASLNLTVKALKGALFNPKLDIWGVDRTPVPGLAQAMSARGTSVKLKKLILPVTGTYYLVVSSADGSFGRYFVKAKLKNPKKMVLAGEILKDGGTTFIDISSPGLATLKLQVGADKKWSDAGGAGNLAPNPGDLAAPSGKKSAILDAKFRKGKFKLVGLSLHEFGVYRLEVIAEPGTRGGYTVKGSVKAGKREKRTILDSDIYLPPIINSMDPTEAFVEEIVKDVTVRGAFFRPGAQILLGRGGAEVAFTNARVQNDTTIVLDVDVNRLAMGAWDLIVQNKDGARAKLKSAFVVKNVPVKNLAMTPNQGFNDEVIDAAITGEQFRGGASVRLFRAGEEIPGRPVNVFAGLGIIETSFDLRGRETGMLDLEVTNEGASPVVLVNALEIVNAPPRVLLFTPGRTHDPAGRFDAEILGSQFDSGATVTLRKTGESPVSGTSVSVTPDGQTIRCSFSVSGKALGLWDVEVRNPDGKQATKANVFLVLGASGGISSFSLSDPAIGPPDVAINTTDREFFVVWAEKTTGGDYTVRGQRFDIDSGSATGSLLNLTTGATGESSTDLRADPAVAWSKKDNRYLVVWTERLPDSNSVDRLQIWGRILNASGSNYGSAIQLSDSDSPTQSPLEDSDNGNPDVIYDTDKAQFLVVFDHHWRSATSTYDPHDVDCILKEVSATGTKGSASSMGIQYREDTPAAAWNLKDLQIILVYRSGNTATSMSGTSIEVTSTFAGYGKGTSISSPGASDTDTDPAVAYNHDDVEALAVWVRNGEKIMGTRFDPKDFDTSGTEITFGGVSGEKVMSPKIAYNPVFNEYIVLWTRVKSAGYEVRARRFGFWEGKWKLLGNDWEISGASGKETFGVPSFLPKLKQSDDFLKFDVYFPVWLGKAYKSGADFFAEKILFRRWK